jgi:antitoxin (DNA-binding transcriptional repressor) of toxin-antitoxin stability system
MYQVTPDEAKSHLEELIEAAMRGKQVVIAHDDQHAVQLVPVAAPAHRKRTAGTARGKITLSDDFLEPRTP